MTPYEQCKDLEHKRSKVSYDGVRIIEDCEKCRLRFVMPNRMDKPGTPPRTIYNSTIFDHLINAE